MGPEVSPTEGRHVVTATSMTPLELVERLAAIIPRPRVHLTRFSGVFAPHYKYRAMVVLKARNSEKVIAAPDEAGGCSLCI